MIKLYHCVEARSFRPLWALEELRLPYQLHVLPFPPRAHAKSFLQLNPLGTIPLLIDGDTRMTESSAICEYLVARYGGGERGGPVAFVPNDADFGRYLNYLSFGEATLTFPIAIYMRYTRLEPPQRKLPQAAEDYRRFFFGRLRVMAQILETQDYLCAAGFSAAVLSRMAFSEIPFALTPRSGILPTSAFFGSAGDIAAATGASAPGLVMM